MSKPASCPVCRRELSGGYFSVARHHADGRVVPQARVCSLLCLINWSCRYATRLGVEGIATIQGAIGRLVNAAKAGG